MRYKSCGMVVLLTMSIMTPTLATLRTPGNTTTADKIHSCSNTRGDIPKLNCDDFNFVWTRNGEFVKDVLRCFQYDKYESSWRASSAMAGGDKGVPEQQIMNASVAINKIVHLNTEKQIMVLDVVLSHRWLDPRLRYPENCFNISNPRSVQVDQSNWEHLWLPDLQVDNMLKFESIDSFQRSHGLRIFEDGIVERFGRFEITIDCPMDFSRFPFDKQICYFDLYINGGSSSDITLHWQRPVEEASNLSRLYVPDWKFHIKTVPRHSFFLSGIDGDIEGVRFYVTFTRVFTNHLLHTYVPSIMLCFGSCLSVFIPSDIVPGRMALCATSFLSVISLFNGARDDWPGTSYMKAIDSWTAGCYVSVFLALSEYCIILYLTKYAEWERKVRKYQKSVGKRQLFRKKVYSENQQSEKIFDENGQRITQGEFAAAATEFGSRIILPLYFLLFNFVYWSIYLSS